MQTNKIISPLYQSLNEGYNVNILKNEAEEYCKLLSKDLRVYLLGLTIGSKLKDNQVYFKEFFKLFHSINNFKNIWSEYTIWQLGDKNYGVINYCKNFNNCEKAIQDIINLLEQYGDCMPQSAARSAAWSAAESAESAESAARSAARSAAWSAWSAESAESAARSAESAARSAESAARSAAESAARSAWSAESAESAARSAARSAAWSAWSAAESAESAESAAYEKMSEQLIKILKRKLDEK